MKVLIADAKGQICGDFFSETETQLESDALRYLNTGVAGKNSILIAGDKVWSFDESDGVLKCEFNQRLTLDRRDQYFYSERKLMSAQEETRLGSGNQESSANLESKLYAARIEYRNAKFRRAVATIARGIGICYLLWSWGTFLGKLLVLNLPMEYLLDRVSVPRAIFSFVVFVFFFGGSFLVSVASWKLEQLRSRVEKAQSELTE
ncbi:MAG: hypothetical protein CMM01_19995 [Rhodopirellula sp.]|nr:hypothetical protein [Rhodopirellula sp.]